MINPLRKLGLLLLVLPAFAPAQVAKQGDGYLIRVKYKTGDVIRYNMTTSSKTVGLGSGPSASVSVPLKVRVVDAKPNRFSLRSSVGPILVNGKPLNGKTSQTVDSVVDARGKALSGNAMGFGTAYPEKPVRPGQKWNSSATVPQLGNSNVDAIYYFRGIENRNGLKVAVIDVNISSLAQGTDLRGKGKMVIRVADGTLDRMSMDLNMIITPKSGKATSVHTNMLMTRA